MFKIQDSNFIKRLTNVVELSQSEIEEISKNFKLSVLKRGANIVENEKISGKLIYIEKGLVRIFTPNGLHSEKEETNWLISEKNLIFPGQNSHANQEDHRIIEALERTEVLLIRKEDLRGLLVRYPQFSESFFLIYQDCLKRYETYLKLLKINSIEERLQAYLEIYREHGNRVPFKYVASFLNMHPSSLSKLRGKRTLVDLNTIG